MYIVVMIALLFLSIGLQVFGLWLSHIIIFNSALSGVAAGLAGNYVAHAHPAICIVIGLVVFLVVTKLQATEIGFWVVGGMFTIGYSSLFGYIAYSEGDIVWGVVVFVLSLLIVGGLHLNARDRIEF